MQLIIQDFFSFSHTKQSFHPSFLLCNKFLRGNFFLSDIAALCFKEILAVFCIIYYYRKVIVFCFVTGFCVGKNVTFCFQTLQLTVSKKSWLHYALSIVTGR